MKESRRRNSNINKDFLPIPFGAKVEGDYFPPPSKSYAIRSLIVASLSKGKSFLKDVGFSDDVKAAVDVIRKWRDVEVANCGVLIKEGNLEICEGKYFVKGSATLFRILLGLFSFTNGERVIDGDESLKKRDFSCSIEAAKNFAKEIEKKGKVPLKVSGKTLTKRVIEINDPSSSQFASGVLIAVSFLKKNCAVKVLNRVSFPYLKMTEEVLKLFGAKITSSKNKFVIEKSDLYGKDVEIEKDYSNASFFIAGAAATNGKIRVYGLKKNSKQGDKNFLKILKSIGINVRWNRGFVEVWGFPKKAIEVDLTETPDLLPPLSVVALKCSQKSIFYGVSRLKSKESSRVEVLTEAIRKIGGDAKIEGDVFTIQPSKNYKGALLDPQNDHRIAMAFAMFGLFAKGTKVKNPDCVKKSYPKFWDDFEKIAKNK